MSDTNSMVSKDGFERAAQYGESLSLIDQMIYIYRRGTL